MGILKDWVVKPAVNAITLYALDKVVTAAARSFVEGHQKRKDAQLKPGIKREQSVVRQTPAAGGQVIEAEYRVISK